jgi:hydroxyacylglutathione hydrolase
LKDKDGKDHALFSGDTLFLVDVGRPDLAQKGELTEKDLAGFLFDSLRNKVMPLADEVIVYPAHGAGSACGKNLSKETIGTIGNQKETNYALRANMTKEEFVKEVTDGLLPPPAYFPLNVKLNKEGYKNIDDIIKTSAKPLSVKDFELIANETDAIILDVRHQSEFIKGFIPQSIFIGIDGGFAPWVGALIKDIQQPILLVTPQGKEADTIIRLSRVGFDNVLGYLDGSFASWQKSEKEIDTLSSVSVEVLEQKINENALVFDVRKPGEFASEHIKIAESTPLDFLNKHISEFPKKEEFYVHCAGGYRSVIAASILKARGFHNVIDVAGGYAAVRNTTIERTAAVCPSTLK